MKKIIMIVSVMLMTLSANAQDNEGKTKVFNFEVKTGTTFPLKSFSDTNNKLGFQIGVEARWNLRRLPIDIGTELYMGSTARTYKDRVLGHHISNRTFSLSAVTDYNFNRGNSFSPFVGMGVGVANCENIKGSYGGEQTRLCMTPRVGFMAFRHLRVTLDAHITRKEYSHAGLAVGYVF